MHWSGIYCHGSVYHLLLISTAGQRGAAAHQQPSQNSARRGPRSGQSLPTATAACLGATRRLTQRANSRKTTPVVDSLDGGSLDGNRWQKQLPAGVVRSPTNKIMWYIPLAICVLSFWSFQWTSLCFHEFVQWASANTWIPLTDERVNLQTNVVVR
jgi:hypothetical protein